MAHEIHIGHVLAYVLAFEVAAFALASTLLLAKWTRYYRNPFYRTPFPGSRTPFPGRAFKSACSVVFTSEIRLALLALFAAFNVVGFALFVCGAIVTWLGLHFSW